MTDRAKIHQDMKGHMGKFKAHEEQDHTGSVTESTGHQQPECNGRGLGMEDRETQHDHPAHEQVQ